MLQEMETEAECAGEEERKKPRQVAEAEVKGSIQAEEEKRTHKHQAEGSVEEGQDDMNAQRTHSPSIGCHCRYKEDKFNTEGAGKEQEMSRGGKKKKRLTNITLKTVLKRGRMKQVHINTLPISAGVVVLSRVAYRLQISRAWLVKPITTSQRPKYGLSSTHAWPYMHVCSSSSSL